MLAQPPGARAIEADRGSQRDGVGADWPIGRITADDEGRVRSANAAGAALLARLKAGHGNLLAALEAAAPGLAAQARALGNGRVLQRRLTIFDGTVVALELRCSATGYEAIWIDETPRRRAEAEAARAAARFEAVADAAERAGVYALDASGRVAAWSRSAARFDGLRHAEALGLDLAEILVRRRPGLDAAMLLREAARRGEVGVARTEGGTKALTLRATRAADGTLDGFVVIVRECETPEEELRRLAETDPLTGVLNRRAFFATAEAAMASVRMRGEPTALIAFDLDNFKSVNDRLGHAAGDAALRALTATARSNVRDGDLIGRLGGDEFAIALPRADIDRATRIAERLRARVERACAAAADACASRLTASFGVAAVEAAQAGVAELLARADAALYRAKGAGKNRIAVG